MNFITKYQKYCIIVVISFVLGLSRWIFLDKDFPLWGLSDTQNQRIKIQKLIEETSSSKTEINQSFNLNDLDLSPSIDFETMQKIVSNQALPIIDARDLESFNEGHIKGAFSTDIELIFDGDEDEDKKLKDFISTLDKTKPIVLYCWDPNCDKAEYLEVYLMDADLFPKSHIIIYKGGWDEWEQMNNE